MKSKTTTRKYSVLYAVTRGEYYEIEAASAKEAEDSAFTDGEFTETGDVTDLVPCEVQKIRAFTPAPTSAAELLEALRGLLAQIESMKGESSCIDEDIMQGTEYREACALVAKETG